MKHLYGKTIRALDRRQQCCMALSAGNKARPRLGLDLVVDYAYHKKYLSISSSNSVPCILPRSIHTADVANKPFNSEVEQNSARMVTRGSSEAHTG